MAEFLYALTPLAVGAVAIVLLLGILNLARAGSSETSQKLMRWRVALQFVAIVIIVLAIWLRGG
jgi:hypothetical protein